MGSPGETCAVIAEVDGQIPTSRLAHPLLRGGGEKVTDVLDLSKCDNSKSSCSNNCAFLFAVKEWKPEEERKPGVLRRISFCM